MKNLQVFNVPLGSNMRDEFCKELKKLPPGEGVMVLPTGLLQNEVRRKYNLPCSGFDTLATKILNLNGYIALEEINRRCQELYVNTALQHYAEQGQFIYFAALKDKQGFVKQMTSLLGQFARSGADVEQVVEALKDWGRRGYAGLKDREVALLYQGYRNMLKLDNRFDLEGKYRLALKVLKDTAQPILPWHYVYVSDFATLDTLQLEFLVALAEHCQVKVSLCYNKDQDCLQASKEMYDFLGSFVTPRQQPGQSPERAAALQHVLQNIGREEPAKYPYEQDNLEIREFADVKNEIKGVLADIKQQLLAGAEPKDFAVGVRNLNDYSGLRRQADSYGIPITLPEVELVGAQPLTELLGKILMAVTDDSKGADAYFAVLDNAVGKLLYPQDNLEELLWLRANSFYGKRSEVQNAVRRSKEGNAFLELVDGFIEGFNESATIAEYTEALKDFLEGLGLARMLGELYKAGDIKLEGLCNMLAVEKRLVQLLDALVKDYSSCNLGEECYSLEEFYKIWQQSLVDATVIVKHGRQDGVLITDVVQLQGASFKNVYLLGLRENEFPVGNRENWLYNDKERGSLLTMGIVLPNTFASYAEDHCLFAGAAAAAAEKLVLCFYRDDEAEASPYIDEIKNLFAALEVKKYRPSQPANCEEALANSALCSTQWLEEQLGAIGMQAAQADQCSGENTGYLKDAELVKQVQRATKYNFSASSLEGYLSCPFSYLAQNIWKLKNYHEADELPDAIVRGNLIHDTLAAFVRRYLKGKPESYDFDIMWKLLERDYEQYVKSYLKEGSILDNEYWPSESLRMQRLLHWWLRFELQEQKQWAGFKPEQIEKGFGYQNVTIKLMTKDNVPVYLNGRIDRIDASDKYAFITDYKSGHAPGDEDIQILFYLLAAEKLCPDKEILGGNYLSLKDRGRAGGVVLGHTGNANIEYDQTEPADWEETRELCQQTILAAVERIYAGDFPVEPAKGACSYCDLKSICRYEKTTKQAGGDVNE